MKARGSIGFPKNLFKHLDSAPALRDGVAVEKRGASREGEDLFPDKEPQTHDVFHWDAVLEKIYISSGHDYWGKQGEGRLQNGITELVEVECVAGMGLRGDRYFGYRPDFKGQVTFFNAAVVEEIRQLFKLPKLPASVFRRNLIVRGVDFRDWIGKRFIFQGIEFEGSQECKPCQWMDRVIADGAESFMKSAYRGGLRAKIRSSGILRIG